MGRGVGGGWQGVYSMTETQGWIIIMQLAFIIGLLMARK